MGLNLAQKILKEHLIHGEMRMGEEIALRMDHAITHDITGSLTLLQFEAMDIPRAKARLSVIYGDHSLLQIGFETADDHAFLQSMAAKYGMFYSRPGNGICHQVHLERFSEPGATMLGADSHTPTCGAVAMLGIGAGGLDVAVALGGSPYVLRMPKIVRVLLKGRLQPWVASKDIVLELLRRLSVKGGVERIFEYVGEGAAALTVPERATICNMGTELGATSSLFPSNDMVASFFRAQQREDLYRNLSADPDASYDETIEIDLNGLEPLIACPGSPDAVVPVREVEGTKVDQVCVGSCTNSSLADLATVAAVLKGKIVHPGVSLTVTPGSRQLLQMISRSGVLADLVDAGARILELSCGPCPGNGQLPATGSVSVRTFNRNFPGRSGTKGDQVYLASPQVAAAAALAGRIVDPRRLGEAPPFDMPDRFLIDDRMIVAPSDHPDTVEIVRGPNIQPVPIAGRAPEVLRGPVLIKAGDNVSTDHIVPSGPKAFTLRSNVPAISEFAFQPVDDTFPRRAREAGGGILVGGSNYGQGSSREVAALVPLHLGIKAVLAKSFARIHRNNLTNVGILPLTFADESDYDSLKVGDVLELAGLRDAVAAGYELVLRNVTRGTNLRVMHAMTPFQVRVYLKGGMLNYVKQQP